MNCQILVKRWTWTSLLQPALISSLLSYDLSACKLLLYPLYVTILHLCLISHLGVNEKREFKMPQISPLRNKLARWKATASFQSDAMTDSVTGASRTRQHRQLRDCVTASATSKSWFSFLLFFTLNHSPHFFFDIVPNFHSLLYCPHLPCIRTRQVSGELEMEARHSSLNTNNPSLLPISAILTSTVFSSSCHLHIYT